MLWIFHQPSSGPITCLDYVDDLIVTGATDKYVWMSVIMMLTVTYRYVKVWSCDSFTPLGVMTHHHPVTALTVSVFSLLSVCVLRKLMIRPIHI